MLYGYVCKYANNFIVEKQSFSAMIIATFWEERSDLLVGTVGTGRSGP